ncbi:hypothetical protein PVAND_009495 [Polypedilum vanderplanki]|uniref:Uncharacterized protein n=1 Tax=Polypedilum vanderplanki TaxID=319348 RepID=A0A9J6CDR0_POLVA|nr:hypothetical protein PVAND_009495 [Polypedilum vanderplanki]
MSAVQIYVEAETIDCHYDKLTWVYMPKPIYYCNVKNRDIFSNGLKVKIDGASGKHWSGFSGNNQVEGISIVWASNMKYFPSNIENVFTNLILIQISNSKLIHITSEDLKPFPKLKFLSFLGNLIEFIPENLFIHNQDLEVIGLDFNKIQHIDKKAFNKLNKLKVLDLLNNVCTSVGNADTRNDVLITIKQIERGACQSDKYATRTEN